MNYTLDFDQLNQVEVPQIILCNRNKKRYGELYPVEDLRITMNANTFHELSFKIPKTVNGNVNPYWDKIVDLKVVFIQKFGFFQIEVDRTHNGIVEYKCITAQSLEVELGQLYLNDFEINSGDIEDEEYDEEKPIVFYNPLDPSCSLLHLSLLKAPAWSIAHVDKDLWQKQRTFDTNQTTIYDFLTGDVADELKCTFQFDTFNRSISVYLVDTYGKDTTLYFSHENLIRDLNIRAPVGEIKNCFKVVGGDGIHINEVNPNGTDRIWNLTDEDRRDMSTALVTKLADYDVLYASYMDEYEKIMRELQLMESVIVDLQHKAPDEPLTGPNPPTWDKLSMEYLKMEEKSILNLEDLYKDKGYGLPSVPEYSQIYEPNHKELLAIQDVIKVRQAEIDKKLQERADIIKRKDALQEILKLDDYLGMDLWLELSLYCRENIYENSNYSITEETTEDERFDMVKSLYEEAVVELGKASTPKFEFTTTMNNILAHPKFREHAKDFSLWDFIRVGMDDDDEIVRVRIISFAIDFGNLAEITVEFSDMTTIKSPSSFAKELLDQARGAATSYDTVKHQYDKAKNSISMIDTIRKEGLEGDLFDIKNSTNADIVINDRGMLCRKWNPEKQDYELDQMHIINNKIVMTDDNWNSARMSIGKIHFNKQELYGVNADVIVGDMILSKTLNIHNSNSSITMDGDGAEFYNCGITLKDKYNTLKMHPKEDNIFEISKDGVKKIWFDANGNANFSGHVSASTIDIGYGAFTVDAAGTVVSRSLDRTAHVTIENGNLLLKGENGYLRHGTDGENYSKVIGVSTNNNIVIGHDKSTWSMYTKGGAFKNINMYLNEVVNISTSADVSNALQFSAKDGSITSQGSIQAAERIRSPLMQTKHNNIYDDVATKSYVKEQYQIAFDAGKAVGYAEGLAAGTPKPTPK